MVDFLRWVHRVSSKSKIAFPCLRSNGSYNRLMFMADMDTSLVTHIQKKIPKSAADCKVVNFITRVISVN